MYVLNRNRPVQFTLKDLRELHGLSLSEVAREIEVSLKTLKRYELNQGKMPSSAIFKIVHFYGVSIDCIYFGTAQECAASNRKRIDFKVNVGEQS